MSVFIYLSFYYKNVQTNKLIKHSYPFSKVILFSSKSGQKYFASFETVTILHVQPTTEITDVESSHKECISS
jgi:hypothetical protein